MQIITIEFKGPTNTTGSRIRVRSWLKSVSISYSHSLNTYENRKEAAQQLVSQLNNDRLEDGCQRLWEITAEGELPCGKGHGFVVSLTKEVNPQ